MKRKTILLSFLIILFSVICFSFVSNLTKEKTTIDSLIKNSDYAVIAQRNILRCETKSYGYVMCGYNGKEPYKQDGKVYTEMYLCCQCNKILGDKITVVTNGYYFKEDDYCFLFLKCIDEKNKLFTPIDDKTGIIKGCNGKLYPMKLSLKVDLDNEFSDIDELFDFFISECEQKQPTEKEVSKSITTAPQTTAAPLTSFIVLSP